MAQCTTQMAQCTAHKRPITVSLPNVPIFLAARIGRRVGPYGRLLLSVRKEIGDGTERTKRDLQELFEKVEPLEKVVRIILSDVQKDISELLSCYRRGQLWRKSEIMAKARCLQTKVMVDASKCSVKVKPAVVKISNVVFLIAADSKGRPGRVVPEDDVTATLTDPSGQAVPTHLQRSERVWEISYTPEVTGNHRLDVKVKGWPVAGSPYDVRVQSWDPLVLTIGKKGSGKGELSNPADVAVDMDGNIAVLESGNQRVQVFNAKTGQSLRCFPVEGDGPCCIDTDSNGQFIVTSGNVNTGKQAIQVYSREGKLTKTLKPDFLGSPRGVAVLTDGRMVVADNIVTKNQKSCLLLQPDGSLIRDIGQKQLQYPWFIAVDESRGLLFVTDPHKVFVFDLDGKLKFSFGKEGRKEGELLYPSGITLDPTGNIIVANYHNRHLQVFRPDGTFLSTVDIVDGGHPFGIALTLDNHIAIACKHTHCVQLYRYK
ncbi:hypothetical protein Bbelb_434780 [Branchiostoma belcheri]|nr:hypothetical protein Bbelb_434780 [Branchiostoma belcheri]